MRLVQREIRCGGVIAFLAWLGFVGLGGPAEAAKKEEFEPMTRPPMPVGAATLVYLGESIEIPLRVRGRVEKPLRILIREKPQHGTLGKVRILPSGREGVVRYAPDAKAKAGMDSFTFAAKSSDSAVSVPARVDISLEHRPARLEYTREWDFGRVAIGDEVTIRVPIRNSGAAEASLDLRGAGPWSIGEETPLSIAGRSRVEVPFQFRPEREGDFRERIPLTAGENDYLLFRGGGFAPLEWDSSGMFFASANRSTGRSAVVFKNLSDRERVIEFEWPDFLSGPRSVNIGPHSRREVEAELKAKPDFAFTGSVAFRCEGFSGRMPLGIESAPANVVPEPSGTIELPGVSSGETTEGKIALANTGGQAANVRLSPEGALELDPDVRSFVLQAGERWEFQVRRSLPQAGAYSERILVEQDSGPALELKILSKARAGKPVEDLLKLPPASGAERQKADLPPVSVFTGARVLDGILELKWRKPSAAVASFLVEERHLKEGAEQDSWKPAGGVVVETSGEEATARFQWLKPGLQTCIRIVPLDAEGRAGEPSRLIEVGLPPEEHSTGWKWILTALAAASGLSAWWYVKRSPLRSQTQTGG